MNFCSHCGAPVRREIPAGDDRPRFVCDQCATIHYQNPRVVVGTIPEWEDRILLCRRAIEPRAGLWTLPAGYLENGETMQDGARRETWEEAGAELGLLAPFALFDLPFVHQIYLIFRVPLTSTTWQAGAESMECRLFAESEIPWEALAFAVMRETLEHYFRDRPQGRFGLHTGTIAAPLHATGPETLRKETMP